MASSYDSVRTPTYREVYGMPGMLDALVDVRALKQVVIQQEVEQGTSDAGGSHRQEIIPTDPGFAFQWALEGYVDLVRDLRG